MSLRLRKFILLFTLLAALGCTSPADFPLEFPTPPPVARATPIPPIELKRDADLERQIAEIAAAAKGKVGVAAVVLETGEAALLNADDHFPMQSVYKLPIAMAVMEKVRLGELELEEKVGVTPEDFVRVGMRSPLRDKNPKGGEFTIRELISLSLVESDGTASDVLMRIVGGAGEVQSYLTQIGIRDIKVVNTEKEIGKDWETQYQNWAMPQESVELLRWLSESALLASHDDISESESGELQLLIQDMKDSAPGAMRLKWLVPTSTIVAHKTGTSGTQNGITAAANDIGIIQLPDSKRLAISVFVSDSPADEKTREAVIAKIAKAAWDRWSN